MQTRRNREPIPGRFSRYRVTRARRRFFAKSRAVQQAHQDKIAPQIAVILDANRSNLVNPEVRVHLAVDDLPAAAPDSGAEKVQIPGVPQAFFDGQKALVMSFGRDAAGRNIRVRLKGDRERVLTVARLFAESSLRTLGTK